MLTNLPQAQINMVLYSLFKLFSEDRTVHKRWAYEVEKVKPYFVMKAQGITRTRVLRFPQYRELSAHQIRMRSSNLISSYG